MTMKQILQCVLVLIVLATAGCGFEDSSSTTSTNKNGNVAANTSGNQTTSVQSTPTINARSANDRLQNELAKASPETERRPTVKPTDEEVKALGEDANQTAGQERSLDNSANQNTSQNQNTQSQNKAGTQKERSLWDWLILALAIALGLLVLVAMVMGVQHLRRQSRRNFEAQLAKIAGAGVSVTKEGQKDLADKLTSLAATQKEISNGLLDVHTEVRSLARLVRESLSGRNDGRHASLPINYQAPMEDSPKDEPEFPVSAGDYLGRMDRFANVVRPDFQNGILVNDPEGKGELMLIRDSRLADEAPLFVVPRATQFQTKQDFYTYYEKYYDCVRPTAGDVWILGPAVVEKVTGGWRLREKGMLEIR